jgi:hypothetical protein
MPSGGLVWIRCHVRLRDCFLERAPDAIAVEIVRSLDTRLQPRTSFGRSDDGTHR